MASPKGRLWIIALLLVITIPMTACGKASQSLTIYSGRGEALVGEILQDFEKETGIKLHVRYGNTASLAATILEEGKNSPADVYFAQDGGALGALQKANRLVVLPESLLNRVDSRLRSPDGYWIGTSGRARVVAYNTARLATEALPAGIWGYVDPSWRGKIGWAPTNASFQAFVTALRVLEGDARTLEWLKGIQANRPKVYPNNTAAVEAVSRGEVEVAFVNHYYLPRFLEEHGESFPVRYYFTEGDAGSMVNVAGVGILNTSKNQEAALKLVEYLLSPRAQTKVAVHNHEYPVVEGVPLSSYLEKDLWEIHAPHIDLSDIDDLEGTLRLMQRAGVL